MSYIGIRNGVKTILGDIPRYVLDLDEFTQQFDEIYPDAGEARSLCAAHIERYYPIYRQFNLLRSGSEDEKRKMGAFIDACRDWSNGEKPDPAALKAIQP